MRICLVNDEMIIAKVLRDFLLDLGHEVIYVVPACELLGSLEQEVDLIIGEFHMTEGDTIAMLNDIHKRHSEITVIIITDDGPTLSTDEAISYGVCGYLHKPIRFSELDFLLAQAAKAQTRGSG